MKTRLAIIAVVVIAASVPPPLAADSPDDDTFVFISTEDGHKFQVTVSNGRGGGQRHITSKLTVYRPAISPDGRRIAFSAPVGDPTLGRYGIAVADLDGTGFQMLTTPQYADFSPTWSADGRRIAFIRDREANLNTRTCCVLRVMDADGSNRATVPGTVGAANPSWSPAGNEIAYDTAEGIFVTNISGTNRRTIAPAGRFQPAWSPNGNEIAFVRDAGAEHRIVVSNRTGTATDVWYATNLTLESPTWDLDGDAISFVRHGGDGYLGRTNTQVWSVDRAEVAQRLFTADKTIVHLARYTRRGPECDFDGDGLSDLAVGIPGEDVSGDANAGAVEVIYGTNSGLSTSGSQQLHRGVGHVAGSLQANARFGAAVVCGDFDADLFSDLAIGAPGSANNEGSVTIMYGSPSGLTSLGEVWSQDSSGIVGEGRANEYFGAALGAGDFDGDGFFDLAVGSPFDSIDGVAIGSVNVIYGSANGLTTVGDQLWHQNTVGVKSAGLAGERFGASLASADFDGNGRDDLAIGAPYDIEDGKAIGAVTVLYGTYTGLTHIGDQRWHQQTPGIVGVGKPGDRFGESLAAGDFGGDGDGDLAIGVPGDSHDGKRKGTISVLYGQSTGLSSDFSDRYHQDTPGINGGGLAGDEFGASLSAGDFDGDNRTDLAIGVPGDTPFDIRAGVVQVLYATPQGLQPTGDQRWYQDLAGIAGDGEHGDKLGQSVAVGDFDGDGFVDLAVGVPGEDISGATNGGAIHIIYGTAAGLRAGRSQFMHQGVGGMSGSLQDGDVFGASSN